MRTKKMRTKRECIVFDEKASNINTLPTWTDLINNIHKIIDNTDNTDNTPPSFLQDREYYQSLIKLIIPNDDEGEVLSGIITGDKTSNRKVLSVFSVFSSYLRERDEKRYKKYYEDRPMIEEKTTQTTLEKKKTVDNSQPEKKSQHQRMKELKECLQRETFFGCGASQTVLYDNFLPSDIDQAIQSNILIRLPNGNYKWGG